MRGRDSTGAHAAAIPALFDMNFQAVSAGQKLPKSGPGDEAGLVGGYLDANGTPAPGLAKPLAYLDAAIGEILAALKDSKLDESSVIILASKHGQSPIDPIYAFHVADSG